MLITTTRELMNYVEVSADLDIDSVRPSIRKAEKNFISRYIGKQLYQELEAAYSEETLNEQQEKLLDYVNCVVAPIAMWYYSQVGGVSIDNSGVYKPKSESRWNLSESEQKQLLFAFLSSGLDALDDLLQFLEENIQDYPSYANSPERKREQLSLVTSASQLEDIFPSLYPMVTFRALREPIRFVEAKVAATMQGFYQHCLVGGSLSPSEIALRDKARQCVIYYAMSRATLTRLVKFTNDGLQVMMGERTQVSEAENSRIETTSNTYENSGNVLLEELIELMNTNPPTGYLPPVQESSSDRNKCSGSSKVFLI